MPTYVRSIMCAVAIGFGLLAPAALPVLAQTAGSTAATPNMARTDDGAPNGSLEKYHGMLRGSELNGANVYNDQGTSIGTINDILIGDDGKVQNIVISVGGFLGVGTHYVSVPFGQLQVQPSRMGNIGAVTDNGITGHSGTATTGTGVAVNTPAPGLTGSGTATNGNAAGTQYFSVVLPGATKNSLTKMPEFHYRG